MPSTHLSLHYHIVFSTKNRRPSISDDWRGRLHSFLGGIVRYEGGIAEMIGGTDDHVHVLLRLRATHRLADVMREIKRASSKWVHEELKLREFGWQEGYGAFTIRAENCAVVKAYILNQDQHHKRQGFQEEYVAMLESNAVEYDPDFLW